MKCEMDLLPTGNIMSYDSTYKLVANSQHIWCFILTFSTHIALQDFPKFTDDIVDVTDCISVYVGSQISLLFTQFDALPLKILDLH